MKNTLVIGIILVVLGIAGLVIQNVRFTETETVAEIGPLQVETEKQRNIPIPEIAGVIAVVAGLGLVFASRYAR
jgi:hypothetical protein